MAAKPQHCWIAQLVLASCHRAVLHGDAIGPSIGDGMNESTCPWIHWLFSPRERGEIGATGQKTTLLFCGQGGSNTASPWLSHWLHHLHVPTSTPGAQTAGSHSTKALIHIQCSALAQSS